MPSLLPMVSSANPELLPTLLALSLISLASLVGSVSFALGKRLQASLPYFVAVAAGTLLGTASTHMLPEAVEHLGSIRLTSLLLLIGLAGSFLLDRLLSMLLDRPALLGDAAGHVRKKKTLATNILVSGAVHSLTDGVAIAIAFAASHEVGVATTVAVLLHEVPHHVADVSVLIYSGLNRIRATLLNLVATSGCAIGGAFVLLSGIKSAHITFLLLPLAAANFLYIGLALLIPEMQRESHPGRSLLQALAFLAACTGIAMLGESGSH